jgi:ankyrin repeat protein
MIIQRALPGIAQEAPSRASVILLRDQKNHLRFRELWKLADKILLQMSKSFLNLDSTSKSLGKLDCQMRGDFLDACRQGNLARLRLYLQVYSDKQEDGKEEKEKMIFLQRTGLHEACDKQHLSIVEFLVKEYHIDRQIQDTSGCTALHYCAMRNFLEGSVILLEEVLTTSSSNDNKKKEENADMDSFLAIQDTQGRTALHWALLKKNLEIARFFVVKNPALLHVQDSFGYTPLHYAVQLIGEFELVKLFIDQGADVNTNVYEIKSYGVQEKQQSFRPKASWAPCGQRFHKKKLQQWPSQQEKTQGTIHSLHSKSTIIEPLQLVSSSSSFSPTTTTTTRQRLL